MNQKEKLEEGGSQSVETKEKERQGRRWLIYFGAAKIWIRVRAPCLKLPTYKLSFIPSPPLSFSPPSFHRLLPPFRSSIFLRAPTFSLSLFRSLRTGSSLIYVGHVYSLAGTWPRRIEKERSDRRDNPFEIIYRIERRPTLLPLVSIIVSRRFIDAPRKRLLPESRLLAIRSLKAIPSRIRGERGGRKAVDRSARNSFPRNSIPS